MTRIPNFKVRKKKQNFFIAWLWLFFINHSFAGFFSNIKLFFTKNKIRVLIIGLVCLSSAFIFSGRVNASANDTPFTNAGFATITSGTNQILGCTTMVQQDYQPTVSWNGDTMTLVPSNQKVGSNQFGWNYNASSDHFFYLVNPDVGTYQLSVTGGQAYNYATCQVFENVDQTNPIYATSSAVTFPYVFNTGQAGVETQVLLPIVLHNSYTGMTPSWNNSPEIAGNSTNHILLLSATTATSSATVYATPNDGNYGLGMFVELRNILPHPIIEVLAPVDGLTDEDGTIAIWADVSNFNLFSISARLHNTGNYNEIYVSAWQATSTATTTVILTPFFNGGYYDLLFGAYNENGTTEIVQNFTVPSPECTSWIYSDWSSCIYGSKTRTILSAYPSGCAGGTPEIWNSCDDSNPYAYWETNITMNNPYTCVPGFDCPIRYNYNQSYYDEGDYIEVINASEETISTSTIIDLQFQDKQNGKSIFYIDTSGMSTTSYFNVVAYHDGASSTPVSLTLNFAQFADNQGEFMPGIATSTEDICEGLDMTVNAFGFPNSFGDTLTCGFKVVMHWAFYPDKKYINQLGDTYKNFQKVIPFSVFYQISNALTSGINSQTLTTNDTFGVPMIRDTGTSTEYYIVPVISSSSMANAIGNENALLVRNTISWIMWILIALGFSILIFHKKA